MRALSLFIHSTGNGPPLWAKASELLPAGAPMRCPANLGVPPNAPVPHGQRVTIEDEVRHLLGAISDVPGAIDLYAHSYGGVVAIELLPALGARVRSLFLYEPVLFGALAQESPSPGRAELDRFPPGFGDDDALGGTRPWLETFIDYWNGPGAFAAMKPSRQERLLEVGWKMYQEVRACSQYARRLQTIRLAAPVVTLVRGERTTAASQEIMAALIAVNAAAISAIVPGVGHMGVDFGAPGFAEIFRAHLGRLELLPEA